jgi:very-short-patch-repair endonuclease
MRRAPTEPERRLWGILRRRQLGGFKFRRQQPVGPYILDFYCFKTKVGIELDGGSHALEDQRVYDEQRREYLASQGICLLRFWNNELIDNPEGVCERIVQALST